MTDNYSFLFLNSKIQSIQLGRDLTKHIKRGHRWIFASSFGPKINFKSGIYFLKYKEEILGLGILQSETQLRFRIICFSDDWFFNKNNPEKTLHIAMETQWKKALGLRALFNLDETNSFRLINGEGDGFPGMVIDIYGDTAVIKYDQPLLEQIWEKMAISKRILADLSQIKNVYFKRRNSSENKGEILFGQLEPETIFKENKLIFSANIKEGSKTGFFLDQRDNRQHIKSFAKNKSVLNLFSYTGGFSLSAASGEAKNITSVDIAPAAIAAIDKNFSLNPFKTITQNIAMDAFVYVEEQIKAKVKFDMVITDPPSFAPNEASVPQAISAYTKIFSDSLKLVSPNGFFAASSCSSHITLANFLEILKEAFSKNRKRGTLILQGGQPFDHPYPLAMEELKYLKFALFQI